MVNPRDNAGNAEEEDDEEEELHIARRLAG